MLNCVLNHFLIMWFIKIKLFINIIDLKALYLKYSKNRHLIWLYYFFLINSKSRIWWNSKNLVFFGSLFKIRSFNGSIFVSNKENIINLYLMITVLYSLKKISKSRMLLYFLLKEFCWNQIKSGIGSFELLKYRTLGLITFLPYKN